MPSPANPHRPFANGDSGKSSPTKKSALDLGSQPGRSDANSVRSKVLSWQQQSDSNVTPDNGYESPTKPTSNAGKENLGRAYRPAGPRAMRQRSNSTPRKRVISDEHWKINRNAARATPPRRQPAPNNRISVYTSNDELLSPQREGQRSTERGSPSLPSRSADRLKARSRERRKSRSPRTANNTINETDSRPQSQGKETAGSSGDISSSPPAEGAPDALSEANFTELSRRRARGASGQRRGPRKLSKGGIFSHMLDESKKIFTDPEPPKPPRGAKIEAWLSDTPDPFSSDTSAPSDIPWNNARPTKPQQSPTRDSEFEKSGNEEASSESDFRRKRSSSWRLSNKGASPAAKRGRQSANERKSPSERVHAPSSARRGLDLQDKEKSPTPQRSPPQRSQHMFSSPESRHLPDGPADKPPIPPGHKQLFPNAGPNRLSTIPSVDTLSSNFNAHTPQPTASPPKGDFRTGNMGSKERDKIDVGNQSDTTSNIKRRLTTHEDLMSVLSENKGGIKGNRSPRNNDQSSLGTSSIDNLMREVSEDETTYMRELKTLVGGVIPVLLTCVLSKSDSALAAGLFRPTADPDDSVNFTKPIIDMGVTLERLKTLHKRLPRDSAEGLVHWGQSAQRVYRDYLKAWRLGFKDVVVNLAPQEKGKRSNEADSGSSEEGMPMDANGDVIGSDGERVDVAYLLKRPLVRLKYLAKTFKGLSTLQPSPKAEGIANDFQNLVAEARKRAAAERARLEDESAANIDATRARDPITMALMTTVNVNKTRRVRARDFFNLSLYHSSGQVVDCRAELLLRDNVPRDGPGGDLLICEVDQTDRWLLFPPVELGCVSARKGDSQGELVMMLRSAPGQKYWRELMSLEIDEEAIASDWVQMLGSNPMPPSINRSSNFANVRQQETYKSVPPTAQRPPANASDIDIPIGESKAGSAVSSNISTGGFQHPLPSLAQSPTESNLKRSKAKRVSRLQESSAKSASSPALASPDQDKSPTSVPGRHHQGHVHFQTPTKPAANDRQYKQAARVSSVPSMDLPTIPKLRTGNSSSSLGEAYSAGEDDDDDTSDPDDAPPAPPPHRSSDASSSSSHLDVNSGGARDTPKKRHGSSPLKHEYEPSTASDSYCSDTSTVRHYGLGDSTSLSSSYDTDSDYDSESNSPDRRKQDWSIPNSVAPTRSVPNNAYRAVPPQPSKVSKAVASVFAWSDKGSWTNMAPGECSVHVGPGLIEAYDMKSNSEDDDAAGGRKLRSTRPLVGLELTPLVPIRRGTAIDISVRSPPTKRSRIMTSNNIMFRSRNAEDCDALYCLINQARVNNPTYIALQNARGTIGGDSSTVFETSSNNRSSGWFGWPRRKKSYRFPPAAARSSADVSESSVGTMSSAFSSALKRLGGGSKMFSIARSTVTSKTGDKVGSSMYSSSRGSSGINTRSTSGIGRIAAAIRGADGIGLSNAKIRLYVRENASKWRDMGAARLTIMPASSNSSLNAPNANVVTSHKRHRSGDDYFAPTAPTSTATPTELGSNAPSSAPSTPRRGAASEPAKRILVHGKTRGEVLLDVCLGESSFERVARTGIAVSVWEANEGGAVAKSQGGVTVGAYRVYMIQMKSEAEAAYTFGLVGKLRY